MKQPSSNVFDQIKVIVKNLETGKLVVMMVLIGLTIAGLITLISWTGKPDYQYLFTNLPQEDAASIVSRLKEQNIPYQLDGNGSAIMVPRENLYDVRLAMASQGLPQGSRIGFEIFDDIKLGMTDFIQNVNYQRAIQGELSRTINSFSEVESSRVHLVISQKSLFVEEEEPSTASVILKLRAGSHLSDAQVQGIVHLVSSSVSRLKAENVTVVDTSGRMLAGLTAASAGAKVSSEQLDYQRSLESSLESRVKTMLESVLGPGKATVRAACRIDFMQQEQTEETFLPDNTVVRSEQLRNEQTRNGDTDATGIPGTASNLENRGAVETARAESSVVRQNKTVNYEIGKVVRRKIMPVGTLLRQSIAVVVDGSYAEGQGAANTRPETYIPRSKDEMLKLEKLVKRAVNFDAARGDEVEVLNIPFNIESPLTAAETPADPGWESRLAPYKKVGKFFLLALFCLMAFIFVIRPLIRWVTASSPWDQEIFSQLPKTISEIENAYSGGSKASPELPYVNQAAQLIAGNNKSAKLLQGWLSES